MSEISATDAGLVGFKLLREKPMVVPAWAIASLAISILTVLAMVMIGGPAMMEVQELAKASQPDPQAMVDAYGRVAPAFLLVLPIALVGYSVLYAAASRLVLRPDERGFGWMKLGADEFRQALAMLLLFLILTGVYLIAALAAGVLIAVGTMLNPAVGALVGLLVIVAALAAVVYVAVRLSLVSPATFATGRVDIGAAWRLTKGRFGQLFGAYVLAWVLGFIVAAVGAALFFLLGIPLFGLANTSQAVFQPDMTSMATMFPPVGIAYYIWTAVVSGVTQVIFLTPAPTLYRQITGGEPAVFE
jgi:hypothetical protein